MKRIKVLALTFALGLAGVVYAASGSTQSTTQDNNASCSTGASCCTGSSCCSGGSCCAARKQ